jgi:hypothetical protein
MKTGSEQGRDEKGGRCHCKRITENMLLVTECRRKYWTKGTDPGRALELCLNNNRGFRYPHPGRWNHCGLSMCNLRGG